MRKSYLVLSFMFLLLAILQTVMERTMRSLSKALYTQAADGGIKHLMSGGQDNHTTMTCSR